MTRPIPAFAVLDVSPCCCTLLEEAVDLDSAAPRKTRNPGCTVGTRPLMNLRFDSLMATNLASYSKHGNVLGCGPAVAIKRRRPLGG